VIGGHRVLGHRSHWQLWDLWPFSRRWLKCSLKAAEEASTMTLNVRDAVAALVMAAIVAPYAAFLVRGEAPYVTDVRVMAVVALVLGAAAFVIAGHLTLRTLIGRAEIVFAAASSALGAVTIVLARTAVGQLLLGALVTGILLTWAMQLLDHAGYPQGATSGNHPNGSTRVTKVLSGKEQP
jgi:hypothetical protein